MAVWRTCRIGKTRRVGVGLCRALVRSQRLEDAADECVVGWARTGTGGQRCGARGGREERRALGDGLHVVVVDDKVAQAAVVALAFLRAGGATVFIVVRRAELARAPAAERVEGGAPGGSVGHGGNGAGANCRAKLTPAKWPMVQ